MLTFLPQMCKSYVCKHIYLCGHRTDKFLYSERCGEADVRGWDCTGDDVREQPMGSSRRREGCAECVGIGTVVGRLARVLNLAEENGDVGGVSWGRFWLGSLRG